MATRTGLVSYGGDSEISDSEDERVSTGQTPPGISLRGLGIPPSRNHQENTPPPPLAPPVISSAPSMGLVAYYGEEDEEGETNEGREDVFKQPHLRRQSSENQCSAPEGEEVPVIEVTGEEEEERDARPLFLRLSAVQLPPEPTGGCSAALQEKIVNLLQKKGQLGIDLNRNVQRRKDYRNPSIYEKLVHFCDLDEFGSNYPEHLYNPHEWGAESFYDSLQKAQKKAYEKKEKAKFERTKVEFVTGTKRPSSAAMATAQEPVKKPRKSKWDVSSDSGSRGGSPAVKAIGAQAIAQANQLNKELSKLNKELSKLAK